jgi:hypothetical protein
MNFIELYSVNRNRQLYPLASNYEVPFAPTTHTSHCSTTPDAVDPVLKGVIEYKFFLFPSIFPEASGKVMPGSRPSAINLDNQLGFFQNVQTDYYIGYTLMIGETGEKRTVTRYNPSTATVTLNKPLSSDPNGQTYGLYLDLPNQTSMFLPSFDINGNAVNRSDQAYTGYYVVFESRNSRYSNSANSNIFSRRISYYDNTRQLIYFAEPLPFTYEGEYIGQLFTIRPSLPLWRWTLDAPTTIVGNTAVLQLPPTAPDSDYAFRGMWVYNASNKAVSYSPPLPTPHYILLSGMLVSPAIPNIFYPIYGAYRIRSYNGQTKQLTVEFDINNTPPPKYTLLNELYLRSEGGFTVEPVGNGFRAYFNYAGYPSPGPFFDDLIVSSDGPPNYWKIGRTYRINLRVRKSSNVEVPNFFVIYNFLNFAYYNEVPLSDEYQMFSFEYIPTWNDLKFTFQWNYVDASDTEVYIEYDFWVEEVDVVNIVPFDRDNYSPLFYSGTMVSTQQAVCYDLSLVSLSLPNVQLATGSTISFYPFLYVLIENVTSATSAAPSLVYSNNPNTARAVFLVTCYPVSNPSVQRFVALGSSVSHTIKFKPNDNLRISVFFADGKLFQPMVPPVLSPYPASYLEQIYAVFAINRRVQLP